MIGSMADEIEFLKAELNRLRASIIAWAKADDAQRNSKPTGIDWWTDKIEAEHALRKAVGR